MVGQTGAGKTTINSMINYLYQVKYNPFRYKLILEKEKGKKQAESQTDYVTSYQLKNLFSSKDNNNNSKSNENTEGECKHENDKKMGENNGEEGSLSVAVPMAVDYDLTIVDTPGFGDTRGVKRDNEIMENIMV